MWILSLLFLTHTGRRIIESAIETGHEWGGGPLKNNRGEYCGMVGGLTARPKVRPSSKRWKWGRGKSPLIFFGECQTIICSDSPLQIFPFGLPHKCPVYTSGLVLAPLLENGCFVRPQGKAIFVL